MAGFRKAKAEQAALKLGIYGPPGSGKTFTSLLVAEGLAAMANKRVAYVDTEHGTDFYCKDVPTRAVHPKAFDFDAIYTRSIMDVVTAFRSLSPDEYSVCVLDSMTHLWMACIEAYGGRQTSIGTIPMHAWGKIKKPYKDLMSALLSSPMHIIICGRQGTEYATDEETDELKAIGVKMKAEGETPYEPHILLRMEAIRPKKTNEVAQIIAYAEKDRTGVLAGRSFVNPTFDSICKPLLGLLGGTQARMDTTDETAINDAEKIAAEDAQRIHTSAALLKEFSAKITLATDRSALKAIGQLITPQMKSQMTPVDVGSLREAYQTREKEFPEATASEPAKRGRKPKAEESPSTPTTTEGNPESVMTQIKNQLDAQDLTKSDAPPTTEPKLDTTDAQTGAITDDEIADLPWPDFVEKLFDIVTSVNPSVTNDDYSRTINLKVVRLARKGQESQIESFRKSAWISSARSGNFKP